MLERSDVRRAYPTLAVPGPSDARSDDPMLLRSSHPGCARLSSPLLTSLTELLGCNAPGPCFLSDVQNCSELLMTFLLIFNTVLPVRLPILTTFSERHLKTRLSSGVNSQNVRKCTFRHFPLYSRNIKKSIVSAGMTGTGLKPWGIRAVSAGI